ncbi:hypothetical protein [Ferrimicrobium sp.]|uniref:hypothetical protein n=1 Tax=Ferrimicrobium sp. TaxID=2926050 RepID=UPI00261A076E|nr:hypothetical protein [Ferrimicrobium sp.]
MVERMVRACLALLIGAIALYLAIRLIASIAGIVLDTVLIAATLMAFGFIVTRLWRRYRTDRW